MPGAGFGKIRCTAGMAAIVGLVCGALAFAQAPQQGQAREGRGGRGGEQRTSTGTLLFQVEWVQPAGQTGQIPVVQANVADSNVEIQWYGAAAKKLLTSGTPGSTRAPFTVWSGECDGPFAITFRHKTYNLDLSGLSKIRWTTKTSGFHVVRPVVKLTDGTMLVGDYAEMHVPMLTQTEFSLSGVRWLRLDPERIVTLAPGKLNPPGTMLGANETWVVHPDLSKVEEFGFADLMPSSGHGTGGYIHVGGIEVYGKGVPR
jgi:hypothetical protein